MKSRASITMEIMGYRERMPVKMRLRLEICGQDTEQLLHFHQLPRRIVDEYQTYPLIGVGLLACWLAWLGLTWGHNGSGMVMKRVQLLSDERLGQDRGIKESFIRCYRIDLSWPWTHISPLWALLFRQDWEKKFICSNSAVPSFIDLGDGHTFTQQQEIFRWTAHVFGELSPSYCDILFEHIGFLARFMAFNTLKIWTDQFSTGSSKQKRCQNQLDGCHTQSEGMPRPIQTDSITPVQTSWGAAWFPGELGIMNSNRSLLQVRISESMSGLWSSRFFEFLQEMPRGKAGLLSTLHGKRSETSLWG